MPQGKENIQTAETREQLVQEITSLGRGILGVSNTSVYYSGKDSSSFLITDVTDLKRRDLTILLYSSKSPSNDTFEFTKDGVKKISSSGSTVGDEWVDNIILEEPSVEDLVQLRDGLQTLKSELALGIAFGQVNRYEE